MYDYTKPINPMAYQLAQMQSQRNNIQKQLGNLGNSISTPGGLLAGLVGALFARKRLNDIAGREKNVLMAGDFQADDTQKKEQELLNEAMKTNNFKLLLKSSNPKLRNWAIKQSLGRTTTSRKGNLALLDEQRKLRDKIKKGKEAGQDTSFDEQQLNTINGILKNKAFNEYENQKIPGVNTSKAGKAQVAIEAKLRGEFAQQSKKFKILSGQFRRITASAKNPTAAGDLSLIFAYMKMLDPESVVRESEQAMAAAARGWPEAMRQSVDKVISGRKLSPKQRADFINRAKMIYDTEFGTHQSRIKNFTDIAKRSGARPEQVILKFGSKEALDSYKNAFKGQVNEIGPKGGTFGSIKLPHTGRKIDPFLEREKQLKALERRKEMIGPEAYSREKQVIMQKYGGPKQETKAFSPQKSTLNTKEQGRVQELMKSNMKVRAIMKSQWSTKRKLEELKKLKDSGEIN